MRPVTKQRAQPPPGYQVAAPALFQQLRRSHHNLPPRGLAYRSTVRLQHLDHRRPDG